LAIYQDRLLAWAQQGCLKPLVASGDDEKMADCIIKILNAPERARVMGERGRVLVAEKFSCDRHLRNTLELYDELLSAPNSSPSRIDHEWRLNE
jgi:glycosyltransferase involved in cell wall biosynthesis